MSKSKAVIVLEETREAVHSILTRGDRHTHESFYVKVRGRTAEKWEQEIWILFVLDFLHTLFIFYLFLETGSH